MKNKSKEYTIGFLMGIIMCLTFYACSHSPLQADYFEMGSINNPMYVKVVQK